MSDSFANIGRILRDVCVMQILPILAKLSDIWPPE